MTDVAQLVRQIGPKLGPQLGEQPAAARGKVALLEAFEHVGVGADEVGGLVARLTDHPWSITLDACRTERDVLEVWERSRRPARRAPRPPCVATARR